MKKIFLLVTVLGSMAIGCNENKQEEKAVTASPKDSVTVSKKSVDWTKYQATSPGEVGAMADHYAQLIAKDPALGIQQINMDGGLLSLLLLDAKGLKLIAAADTKTNDITMFMQFWIKDSFYYYNIKDFFISTEKGMRGQPAICPPPAGCDLPFSKSVKPLVITEEEAQAMATKYNEMVLKDPAMAVRQITMDGFLLEILLYDTEGLKLIAGYDEQKSETTMIMQFWKGGEFYYYDIRDIFTPDMKGMRGQQPLCPPPAGCDLPFGPKPTTK